MRLRKGALSPEPGQVELTLNVTDPGAERTDRRRHLGEIAEGKRPRNRMLYHHQSVQLVEECGLPFTSQRSRQHV